MFLDLAGRHFLNPLEYPGQLVVQVDCGDEPCGENHPECGVFSGRHDGFEYDDEMNQRMPEVPWDDALCGLKRFKIDAPSRTEEHRVYRYHYAAISWKNCVYIQYPESVELVLQNHCGTWSLSLADFTYILTDYQPGS